MYPTVHPSLIDRWKRHQLAEACGHRPGCGRDSAPGSFEGGDIGPEYGASHEGGAFGVRRPLRLLAYKLGLDEAQVAEMARILDALKTERAQAAVDERRTLTAFAESIGGDVFDEALARKGAESRRKGGERLADAVVEALGRMHAILQPEQRAKFAYLIRTGVLVL